MWVLILSSFFTSWGTEYEYDLSKNITYMQTDGKAENDENILLNTLSTDWINSSQLR